MPSLVLSMIRLIQAAQDPAEPLERDAEPAGQSAEPDIVRPSAKAGQGVVSAVETASTRWVN